MKILFITELYPAPNQGGEYLRTNGFIKILKNTGFDYYAIFGLKNGIIPEIDLPKEKFTFYDFSSHYAYNRIIIALKTFIRQSDLISLIDAKISELKPDLVFIDYNYFGQYIPYIRKKGLPVIYGTHNIQSQLTIQHPASTIKNKIVRYLLFKTYQFHEKFYLKKANAILTVSEKDSEYYNLFIDPKKIFCIPNFIDGEDYKITNVEKKNYIVMPGNFEAYQNKMGLKWFLENVWDAEISKLTQFIIIGKSSDTVFNQFNKNKNYKNIKAYGEVDEIKPFIYNAKATIAPLLHGSGTRLKCIESMALKTQIISTSIGAEGIYHEGSIIIADNPAEFKNAIFRVIKENIDHTEKAYNIFENKYSLNYTTKIFNEVTRSVIAI